MPATATTTPEAGEDTPVTQDSDLTILQASRAYKKESETAKLRRDEQNRQNVQMFLGRQDWSHKTKGQSKQVIPKVPLAVEQTATFVKIGLTSFGQWFNIVMPPESTVSPTACEQLLAAKLRTLSRNAESRPDFSTLIADAVKTGLLQNLVILKVHGALRESRQWVVKRGTKTVETPGPLGFPVKVKQPTETLRRKDVAEWELLIDLVRPADFYHDPTGRGLYEMHEVERDVSDVKRLSEGDDPIYDPKVIARLEADYARVEDEQRARRDRESAQQPAETPEFRRKVIVQEFWGTILDDQGEIATDADGLVLENVVWAVANDRFVIRAPEANPWWHQQSPFVVAALMRVPFSTLHKAPLDHAVQLNIAQSEMFSLMLDGALAAVHGVKQLRHEYLENPAQVADGIPAGITLIAKSELPANMKLLETLTEGHVPPDALAMYNLLDRESDSASKTNATAQGQLPDRQVKATEIVATQQGAASYLDGMITDLELTLIGPLLWKAWCCLLQHADDLDSYEVVQAIGARQALALGRMSPAERFAAYAGCRFQVTGLSAIKARAQEFQKQMALMQAVGTNPLLMEVFNRRYSPDKWVAQQFRNLNLDPEQFERSPEEQEQMAAAARMQQLAGVQQAMGGPKGQGSAQAEQPAPGQANMASQVQQQVNPLSGMTATP